MIDVQQHVELQDLISRYVWALDTGDAESVCALFTPDAVVLDTSGSRYAGIDEVRGFFTQLTQKPAFRGRQHHVDHPLFADEGAGVRARCYWTVTQWLTAPGQKVLVATGHSSDLFVQTAEGWRFRERLLHYWRDTDCPWTRP